MRLQTIVSTNYNQRRSIFIFECFFICILTFLKCCRCHYLFQIKAFTYCTYTCQNVCRNSQSNQNKKHKTCKKKNLKNVLHNFTGSNSITITKIYFQSHTYKVKTEIKKMFSRNSLLDLLDKVILNVVDVNKKKYVFNQCIVVWSQYLIIVGCCYINTKTWMWVYDLTL